MNTQQDGGRLRRLINRRLSSDGVRKHIYLPDKVEDDELDDDEMWEETARIVLPESTP